MSAYDALREIVRSGETFTCASDLDETVVLLRVVCEDGCEAECSTPEEALSAALHLIEDARRARGAHGYYPTATFLVNGVIVRRDLTYKDLIAQTSHLKASA
jgi:hypothetical protein